MGFEKNQNVHRRFIHERHGLGHPHKLVEIRSCLQDSKKHPEQTDRRRLITDIPALRLVENQTFSTGR